MICCQVSNDGAQLSGSRPYSFHSSSDQTLRLVSRSHSQMPASAEPRARRRRSSLAFNTSRAASRSWISRSITVPAITSRRSREPLPRPNTQRVRRASSSTAAERLTSSPRSSSSRAFRAARHSSMICSPRLVLMRAAAASAPRFCRISMASWNCAARISASRSTASRRGACAGLSAVRRRSARRSAISPRRAASEGSRGSAVSPVNRYPRSAPSACSRSTMTAWIPVRTW